MRKRLPGFAYKAVVLESLGRDGKVISQDDIYVKSRLATLQRSVDDSAQIYRTGLITFLTLVAYFLAIALSVDHEALFKDAILKAPILNIGIKTSSYFTWAPLIFLFLHLGLLTQASILNKKTNAYIRALKDLSRGELRSEALGLLPSLPLTQIANQHNYSRPFVDLLWLLAIVTLTFIPIAVLIFILLQFLPYQGISTSVSYGYIILTDLTMSCIFWKMVGLYRTAYKVKFICVSATVLVLITAIMILFVILLIETPINNLNVWKKVQSLEKIGIEFKLSVPRKRLYLETDRSPSDVCEAEDKTSGLDLTKRSYIKANLSEAVLCHAILVDAKLQRAKLYKAKLQRANLYKAELQGAKLRGAELQGADLRGAALQGADLRGAALQGANLRGAELQGANLSKAKLQGANLSGAALQGANLRGAELQGVQSKPVILFEPHVNFVENINASVGTQSVLGGIVISGGLTQEDVADTISLIDNYLDDKDIENIRNTMEEHVDKPPVHADAEILSDMGAVVGEYSREEADQWIREYEEDFPQGRRALLRLEKLIFGTGSHRTD